MKASTTRKCWCGNDDLEHFHGDYVRCEKCETIVLQTIDPALTRPVTNDDADFYGKQYYQEYVVHKRGFPTIEERARLDLPERCLHWLKATLRYCLPPGRLLELGSAHGGFVAMAGWCGFESMGLEMSPWLVDYSRRTFEVEVLTGPVENQTLDRSSLDVIALFDVLEHFEDPRGTMSRCADLLRDDGIIIVQTPCYPAGQTYAGLIDAKVDFPLQLKPEEHLYLFSEESIRSFFRALDFPHLEFEPAIFSNYDMFVVASRRPLARNSESAIAAALQATPRGRLMLAMLDLDDRNRRSGG